MRLGVYVLGIGAITTGVVDLIWRSFDRAEEPIQAFGDQAPAHTAAFACVIAVLLIVGGITVMRPRSVRLGASLLTIGYLVFAVFWSPRLVTATQYLGLRGTIGALGGIAQEVIVIAAVAIVYASWGGVSKNASAGIVLAARWAFGLSTIVFGLAHLTNVASIGSMVPGWMPLGGKVWAVVTGIAFLSAGVGILTGILDVLAARLLTIMLAIFSALALAPQVAAFPYNQSAYGVNVYNLAAIGAAWVLADWLSERRAALATVSSVVKENGEDGRYPGTHDDARQPVKP